VWCRNYRLKLKVETETSSNEMGVDLVVCKLIFEELLSGIVLIKPEQSLASGIFSLTIVVLPCRNPGPHVLVSYFFSSPIGS